MKECRYGLPCDYRSEIDLAVISQLVQEREDSIRADERKKVLEWLCHHSTDYNLIDEHGMYVDSEDMQYGWNCKQYEAKTIDNVLTDYEKWLKGEQT